MSNDKARPKVTAGEVLTAVIPPEPPHTSIVLDARQWGWQHLGGRWVRMGTPVLNIGPGSVSETATDWTTLVAAGPVRVLWVPEPRSDAK